MGKFSLVSLLFVLQLYPTQYHISEVCTVSLPWSLVGGTTGMQLHDSCSNQGLRLLISTTKGAISMNLHDTNQVAQAVAVFAILDEGPRAGQAQEDTSPAKIDVTSKSPVGDISVVTLIRTDTTLDHSQKAEKVWI